MNNQKINILSFSWLVKEHPRFVTIASHVLFWFAYLMIHTALTKLSVHDESFFQLAYLTTIYFLPVDILATYFTLYVLMPLFLYKGKFILFIISLSFSAVLFILLTQVVFYYLYVPVYYPKWITVRGFWEFKYWYYVLSVYGIVVLAAAIKLTKRWYEQKDRQTELKNQNLKSELNMLKLQISPHFLFNTLNNVDSLIYTNPEKASETIVKLSDIMRYMLYESQYVKVPLTNELEYLNNLVELHSLRISKENFIAFNIIGEPNSKEIAPLLFVPFVENAIKHGAKDVNVPGITINLEIKEDQLFFTITNFINNEQNKDPDGGIGLSNVSRRLDLLYPKKHDLKISETDKLFCVELVVNL